MSNETNSSKNKKPIYEIKETPLLKKILNKILQSFKSVIKRFNKNQIK